MYMRPGAQPDLRPDRENRLSPLGRTGRTQMCSTQFRGKISESLTTHSTHLSRKDGKELQRQGPVTASANMFGWPSVRNHSSDLRCYAPLYLLATCSFEASVDHNIMNLQGVCLRTSKSCRITMTKLHFNLISFQPHLSPHGARNRVYHSTLHETTTQVLWAHISVKGYLKGHYRCRVTGLPDADVADLHPADGSTVLEVASTRLQ